MISEDELRGMYRNVARAVTPSGEARLRIERAVTRRRKVRTVAGVGVATFAVVGVVGVAGLVAGQQGEPVQQEGTPSLAPATSADPSAAEVAGLFSGLNYDYTPVSEEVLLQRSELVVRGTIQGFDPGRIHFAESATDPQAFPQMVMHVAVSEVAKGTAQQNDIVHVELPLAGQNLQDYSSVLPVGTEVVLFLERAQPEASDFPVGDEDAGRPIGAPLWAAGPQGFIVGVRTGLVLPLAHAIRPDQTLDERMPTSDLQAEFAWQGSIDGYTNELVTTAEQYDNYTGAAVKYSERAIIVYGAGQPPPEVAELLSRSPGNADARWVTVPYSKDELEQAGDELSKVIPRVTSTTYANDYSTIIVGVRGLPTTQSGMQRLRELAAQTTDIPVTFEEQGFAVPLPAPPST